MTDNFSFGYPKQCVRCASLSKSEIALRVAPHYKEGNGLRVILIGQDPTIFNQPERVSEVLMLNEPNAQLSRWLKKMFGKANFQALTLYATNLVKCSFAKPPSISGEGGLKFLKPYFQNCKDYLAEELLNFKPKFVLTLGEPTHKLFVSILDNQNDIPGSMQAAFTGQFIKAKFDGLEFDYSPCLHIKTFRVAEVYGDSVQRFKQGISAYFNANSGTSQNRGVG